MVIIMYKRFLKRCFDILISLLLIIILSPLFLCIYILIKVSSPGKVIYKHKRYGYKGKIITIYKFRTMVENAETLEKKFNLSQKKEYFENFKLKNDFRIIKNGKFLRKYCLDELPQLFNVLKGDMSLVGPRPIVKRELDKYKTKKNKLLSIKPGLTGLWQINKNKITNYKKRMETELFYVDNYNFLLDLEIIFLTLIFIFKGNDY